MATIPNDGFYTDVNYAGAFGDKLWINGWTFISEAGITAKDAGATVIAYEAKTGGIPSNFALSQNHPNPFNPSTVIRFNLEMQQQVSLQIFDILGQRVATLVDGIRQAGSYEVRLDAADLSSGVYFYRLQGGNQQLTRKMTLSK